MSQDLRSLLKRLEADGELKRVRTKIDPQLELASVVRKSEIVGGPALLFENVEGYKMPVAAALLSTVSRVACALNTTKEHYIQKIAEALDNPIKPKQVTDGAVIENKIVKDIDIQKLLPVPRHALKDSGPFISAGVVVSRDPETQTTNLSYHRMEVKGPRKLTVNIDPLRHLGEFYEKAEAKGVPLEIAVCIGTDPSVEMAAAVRMPSPEIELAGALKGEAIRLTRCETVDVDVPADSEIVVEGKILPKIRETDGPFGEFPGYYGYSPSEPIMEVTAIIHRDEPIFRTIPGASAEHLMLGNVVPREPQLYRFVKHAVPSVKSVHIPPYGSGFIALISISKQHEGLGKNALLAALTSHLNLKYAIVVDEDVDIYDPKDVLWAIATRVQADRDMVVVPNARGSTYDPSSRDGVTAKVGIDATVPLEDRAKFERVKWKDLDKIDLNSYLS